MSSKISGGLGLVGFMWIIAIFSGIFDDDGKKNKKDTSVNAEPSTITEVKTNTG